LIAERLSPYVIASEAWQSHKEEWSVLFYPNNKRIQNVEFFCRMDLTVKIFIKIIQDAFFNPLMKSKKHIFVSLIQISAGFVPFSVKSMDRSPLLIISK
jgi:hypothetical protein